MSDEKDLYIIARNADGTEIVLDKDGYYWFKLGEPATIFVIDWSSCKIDFAWKRYSDDEE